MKIIESTFNSSVKKKLILSYKFDRFLLDMEKSTNQTFYQIFFKLSDINDIFFGERETKDDVLDKKKINYILERQIMERHKKS